MFLAAHRLGALSLLAACLSAPAASAAPGLMGLWLDQAGRAAIDIEPCSGSLCGTIVWLKEPLAADGKPKTDINNTEASRQSRKICGLVMVYGFAPDGADGWKNGYIYDPSVGKTYNANIHLSPDGTLKVRGYLQYTWLGQTQVWTRPAGALPACK